MIQHSRLWQMILISSGWSFETLGGSSVTPLYDSNYLHPPYPEFCSWFKVVFISDKSIQHTSSEFCYFLSVIKILKFIEIFLSPM